MKLLSTGVLDPKLPNVQVTGMTLMCDAAPSALVLDLTGECGRSPLFLAEDAHFGIQ